MTEIGFCDLSSKILKTANTQFKYVLSGFCCTLRSQVLGLKIVLVPETSKEVKSDKWRHFFYLHNTSPPPYFLSPYINEGFRGSEYALTTSWDMMAFRPPNSFLGFLFFLLRSFGRRFSLLFWALSLLGLCMGGGGALWLIWFVVKKTRLWQYNSPFEGPEWGGSRRL